MQRYIIHKTVEVTIPGIEAMRLAHYVTIGSECSTSLSSHLEKLYVIFQTSATILSSYVHVLQELKIQMLTV